MVLALLTLPGWGSPAGAQWPRARLGEFEVRGFDLPQDGGWRTQGQRVLAARRMLLSQGAFSRLNTPGSARPAVSGNYFVPVIPITFRDVNPAFVAPLYQDLLFAAAPSTRPWSLRSFYQAQSRGLVNLDGAVFDWIRVDSSASWYEDTCNGIGVLAPCPTRARSRMADLLISALDSVSLGAGGDTVWNRFDNDGPDGLPNSGDDDGTVDLVTFLQPKVDGACGTTAIWAHRYRIAGWTGGQSYVTRTPRRSAGGATIPGQFLRVNGYSIQSAEGGNTACTPGQIMPIGTVAHETGHAFGLPDLYDTDATSGTEGIGEWGLMGSGNYARPYSPGSFDAWSLSQLGWVVVDTVSSTRTTTTAAVQSSDTVFYASTASPDRYLLIENRQREGTDTAMMNPAFVRPKGPGLLIWLVDDPRIDAGRFSNTVNTGAHQGLSLMQADGRNQLRSNISGVKNRGDAGDPFPGNSLNRDFGLMGAAPAVDFSGAPLGIRIDGITTFADGRLRFRYVRRAASLIASRTPLAKVRVNEFLAPSISEIFATGDTLALSADEVQTTADGRSGARFLRWSDGGARVHQVIARAGPPDTLFADFALAHRVRLLLTGPGTLSVSLPGDPAAGIFADVGTVVRVTATVPVGVEFLGWRGDTTTAAPVLDLPMNHPFDLVADFVSIASVDASAAARALLGGTPLDPAASRYLDATGNRNGTFDVGDYLAWLRRTGQRVPAALLRLGSHGGVTR
ncbi:MAG: M6 family metalloprotease domain-containing protein [Gemmatimonadota bacterium]